MSDCKKFARAISAFVDGQLDDRQTRGLEAHLAGCPSCRAVLESWRAANEAARDVPAVDEKHWEEIWQRVEKRSAGAQTPTTLRHSAVAALSLWRAVWKGAAVTALAASILLAAYFLMRGDGAAGRPASTGGRFEVVSIEVEAPDYDVFVMAPEEGELPVIWLEGGA